MTHILRDTGIILQATLELFRCFSTLGVIDRHRIGNSDNMSLIRLRLNKIFCRRKKIFGFASNTQSWLVCAAKKTRCVLAVFVTIKEIMGYGRCRTGPAPTLTKQLNGARGGGMADTDGKDGAFHAVPPEAAGG